MDQLHIAGYVECVPCRTIYCRKALSITHGRLRWDSWWLGHRKLVTVLVGTSLFLNGMPTVGSCGICTCGGFTKSLCRPRLGHDAKGAFAKHQLIADTHHPLPNEQGATWMILTTFTLEMKTTGQYCAVEQNARSSFPGVNRSTWFVYEQIAQIIL